LVRISPRYKRAIPWGGGGTERSPLSVPPTFPQTVTGVFVKVCGNVRFARISDMKKRVHCNGSRQLVRGGARHQPQSARSRHTQRAQLHTCTCIFVYNHIQMYVVTLGTKGDPKVLKSVTVWDPGKASAIQREIDTHNAHQKTHVHVYTCHLVTCICTYMSYTGSSREVETGK